MSGRKLKKIGNPTKKAGVIAIIRISGPWPFPCDVCGAEMYIDRFVDRERNRTTNRFFCPCGVDMVLRREFDIEHDLLPFPRPAFPAQSPRDEGRAISKAELLEMLREVVDELLDQRLGGGEGA